MITKIIVFFLVCVVGVLGILQTSWAKEKLTQFIYETAKKGGFVLSVGKIEGGPPFKWTLHDVHLQLSETDSLDMKTVYLRIAILPLFRKELSISYFLADEAHYRFQKSEGTSLASIPWNFSIKALKIEKLLVEDLSTKKPVLYALQGKARFKKNGRAFFVEAKANSSDLTAEILLEGSKRTEHIATEFKIDARSKDAFAPFFLLPDNTTFNLETRIQGPRKSWKGLFLGEYRTEPLTGEITAQFDIPRFEKGKIESSFQLYGDRSFDISSLSFKSELICLKGEGKFDSTYFPASFKGSYLLPHLSYLVPQLSGIASGEATYDGKVAGLTFESETIEAGPFVYADVKGAAAATLQNDRWSGSAHLDADQTAASVDFTYLPSRLILKDLAMRGPEAQVRGDLDIDLEEEKVEGTLFAQANDLSLFLPDSKVAGKFGGQIQFQGSEVRLSGLVKNFEFFDILSTELSLDCQLVDLFTDPKGKVSFEGRSTYISQFFFDTLAFSTSWEENGWPFSFEAKGKWKEPLEITATGSWDKQGTSFDLHIDTFWGTLLQKPFSLVKPFSIHSSDKALVITEGKIQLAEGYFMTSVDLSTTLSKVHVKAEHFPIDLFAVATTRFTLNGNSSLDISLEGSQDNLSGRINLLLENAEIYQSGKKNPIQSKGSLQANFDKGLMQIHTLLLASQEQFFELTGTVPIVYNLYPFQIGLEKSKPLAGELTMEGNLEEIFDFINIGSQRITGLFSCHLFLSKNLFSPSLQGNLELQNGSYENYFTGIELQDIQLAAQAEGNRIEFASISATDGKEGKLSAKGTVALQEKLPFSFDANVENLQILNIGWLSSSFSGPLLVTGNIEEALAKGELTISEADIKIPEELPIDLPILPVTFVNTPSYIQKKFQTPEQSYPFQYDAVLNAPGKINLTGRGLNCELEGNLHVTGRNLAVSGTGTLRLVKGKFSFAGKDFILTNGELDFSDKPYLNITGTLALPDLTVTALLRGPLASPQLTFQSSPAMPTSSILARILFNKDISELTAPQALQLADTIVTLSGGAGPSVLESIRKSLGIDRLNITSSPNDPDQVAVQIGKYLTKGVMVTLSQSTEGSQVIVEVELKGGFVLQAETQEDEQGKFSFKWNKNY